MNDGSIREIFIVGKDDSPAIKDIDSTLLTGLSDVITESTLEHTHKLYDINPNYTEYSVIYDQWYWMINWWVLLYVCMDD